MLNDKAHHQIKFKFDHPEHGPVEGQATIPKSVENPKHSDVTLHTMGLEGDMHVTPEDLGEGDHALGIKHALKTHLDSKLGKSEDMEKCGEMSKSEKKPKKLDISNVKVHDVEEAERGVSDKASNVNYSAHINGVPHKFYTEALDNKIVNKMHDAESTGKIHPHVHDHISFQHKNEEGEEIKKVEAQKLKKSEEFGLANNEVVDRIVDGIDFSKEEFSVEEVGQMVLAKGYSLSKGSYDGMTVKENISKSSKDRLSMMKARVDENKDRYQKMTDREDRNDREVNGSRTHTTGTQKDPKGVHESRYGKGSGKSKAGIFARSAKVQESFGSLNSAESDRARGKGIHKQKLKEIKEIKPSLPKSESMMKAKIDNGLSIAEKQNSRDARQERYHPDGYSSERNMPPAPHPDTIGNEEEYNEYIDPKRRDKFGADLQRVKAKEQMGKLPVGTTKEMTSRGEHGNVRGHVQENSGHYADPENIRTGVGMHPSRKSRPGSDKKQEPMRSGKEGGFYNRQGQARRQEVLQSAGPGEFDRETRSFPYDQAPERTPQQARVQRIKEIQDRSQARVANERNIAGSRVLPKSESMMKARVDDHVVRAAGLSRASKDKQAAVKTLLRRDRNDRQIAGNADSGSGERVVGSPKSSKGVHQESKNPNLDHSKGASPAGNYVNNKYSDMARDEHKDVIREQKEMKKPNLPKSEGMMKARVDEGKSISEKGLDRFERKQDTREKGVQTATTKRAPGVSDLGAMQRNPKYMGQEAPHKRSAIKNTVKRAVEENREIKPKLPN